MNIDTMPETPRDKKKPNNAKHPCLITIAVVLFLIFLIALICLILALIVFKAKQPRTSVVSATVDGVAPRVSFTTAKIELNSTVDLVILIKNRNCTSFRHGQGKCLLLYQGTQVGDVDIALGNIPARGNAMLPAKMTEQDDRLASEMSNLVSDALSGELVIQTKATIPERFTLLGLGIGLGNLGIGFGYGININM